MRNLQEQVKKAFCYQKSTVWINCSSDLKKISNPRPSASIFKSFSQSLEQIFPTVGQNSFGNKIPFFNKWTKGENSNNLHFIFSRHKFMNYIYFQSCNVILLRLIDTFFIVKQTIFLQSDWVSYPLDLQVKFVQY